MFAAVAPRTFRHPLLGNLATFLETSEETGGARTVLELQLPPGGGHPAHRHHAHAERFVVVAGTMTLVVDGETRRLGAQDSAVVGPDLTHSVANQTAGDVRVLVEVTPGHTGLERAIMAAYGLAADGLTRPDGVPHDPLHTAVLLDWAALGAPGGNGDGAAREAIADELIRRYCAW